MISKILLRRSRPAHQQLKSVSAQATWIVYFMFMPEGQIQPSHRFTLRRLRETEVPLLLVCATPHPDDVPSELWSFADALYWKSLGGYDFSGYTLALEALVAGSPGCDTLLLNDSMLGPFADLRTFIASARWDLTGFTASALNENHVQSYAFIIKNVTEHRLGQLRTVFYDRFAFNSVDAVIWCQELQMARLASKHMTVGAYWYADKHSVDDPCLRRPLELVETGFPFIKKSLLGKMAHFQNPAAISAFLETKAHPL